MSSEFKKIRSFHIIDIKYKTKYKRFVTVSNNFTIQSNYIAFKGAELNQDSKIDNLNDINELIANTEIIERYYPWTSVVEIQIKRYEEE